VKSKATGFFISWFMGPNKNWDFQTHEQLYNAQLLLHKGLTVLLSDTTLL
jgi:hypothetical protein